MSPAFQLPVENVTAATLPADALYLVLLRTDRIPPHLGLLCSGAWFTLDVKGPVFGTDASRLLQAIERRQMPSAFVQLAWPRGLSREAALGRLGSAFSAYAPLGEGTATCISPVRDFVSGIYDKKTGAADFVYQLLHMLGDAGLIVRTYAFYQASPYLEIPEYGMPEVRASIVAALARAGTAAGGNTYI